MNDSPADEYAALKRLQDSHYLESTAAVVSRRPASTSVFGILRRIARSESMHSDMFAWLLRPDGSHRLGSEFAVAFLRSVVPIRADQALEIESVHTEFPTGCGPVDILVEATVDSVPFAIALENKIDASETGDQLERYIRGLRAQSRFSDRSIFVIFLTINGSQPVLADKQFPVLCAGYAVVRDTLRVALAADESRSAECGRALAQDYFELLKVEIMKESDVARLCSEMYRDHPDAWRAIRRRLPSERDDWLTTLAEGVCQRFTLAFGAEWRFSIQKDRYARVWRSDWENMGAGIDSPIAGVEGAHWTFAQTHFRLSLVPPAPDSSSEHFRYEVRLKWSRRAPSIIEGLRTIAALSKQVPRGSSTTTLRVAANRRLPGVNAAPGTVIDWIMETPVSDVVDVVDALRARQRPA